MEAKAETLNRLCLPATVHNEFIECPTCDQKLAKAEVAQHVEQEMQRLRQQESTIAAKQLAEQANSADGQSEEKRLKSWSIYNRVRGNRQSRMRQRNRKRVACSPPATSNSNGQSNSVESQQQQQQATHACPVCQALFPTNEIQRHAERCLRSSNAANGNGESSNEEDESGGEEYEEYEWAGQKRIRVSSMVQGGYAALLGIGSTNGSSSHANNGDDEDEDLNVDEDDTHIYGPTQYAESDVITTGQEQNSNEHNVTNYMRRLITGDAAATNSNSTVLHESPTAAADIPSIKEHSTAASPEPPVADLAAAKEIIYSLKAKLRHIENHGQSKFKCLICLDDYRNPAISVSCWHVHCEQCWLRSLGARKLCPQCNLITTPKDLRRIYM